MQAVLTRSPSIMDECKRMGIKVLGPDINESKKGFAVNSKGRDQSLDLGGLKGVGESAVESIIQERVTRSDQYKNHIRFYQSG